MSRDSANAPDERSALRPAAKCPQWKRLYTCEMNQLTDQEISSLLAACNDPNNTSASNLLAFAGTRTISGVIAKLMRSTGSEHETLLKLIRSALDEHARLHPRG